MSDHSISDDIVKSSCCSASGVVSIDPQLLLDQSGSSNSNTQQKDIEELLKDHNKTLIIRGYEALRKLPLAEEETRNLKARLEEVEYQNGMLQATIKSVTDKYRRLKAQMIPLPPDHTTAKNPTDDLRSGNHTIDFDMLSDKREGLSSLQAKNVVCKRIIQVIRNEYPQIFLMGRVSFFATLEQAELAARVFHLLENNTVLTPRKTIDELTSKIKQKVTSSTASFGCFLCNKTIATISWKASTDDPIKLTMSDRMHVCSKQDIIKKLFSLQNMKKTKNKLNKGKEELNTTPGPQWMSMKSIQDYVDEAQKLLGTNDVSELKTFLILEKRRNLPLQKTLEVIIEVLKTQGEFISPQLVLSVESNDKDLVNYDNSLMSLSSSLLLELLVLRGQTLDVVIDKLNGKKMITEWISGKPLPDCEVESESTCTKAKTFSFKKSEIVQSFETALKLAYRATPEYIYNSKPLRDKDGVKMIVSLLESVHSGIQYAMVDAECCAITHSSGKYFTKETVNTVSKVMKSNLTAFQKKKHHILSIYKKARELQTDKTSAVDISCEIIGNHDVSFDELDAIDEILRDENTKQSISKGVTDEDSRDSESYENSDSKPNEDSHSLNSEDDQTPYDDIERDANWEKIVNSFNGKSAENIFNDLKDIEFTSEMCDSIFFMNPLCMRILKEKGTRVVSFDSTHIKRKYSRKTPAGGNSSFIQLHIMSMKISTNVNLPISYYITKHNEDFASWNSFNSINRVVFSELFDTRDAASPKISLISDSDKGLRASLFESFVKNDPDSFQILSCGFHIRQNLIPSNESTESDVSRLLDICIHTKVKARCDLARSELLNIVKKSRKKESISSILTIEKFPEFMCEAYRHHSTDDIFTSNTSEQINSQLKSARQGSVLHVILQCLRYQSIKYSAIVESFAALVNIEGGSGPSEAIHDFAIFNIFQYSCLSCFFEVQPLEEVIPHIGQDPASRIIYKVKINQHIKNFTEEKMGEQDETQIMLWDFPMKAINRVPLFKIGLFFEKQKKRMKSYSYYRKPFYEDLINAEAIVEIFHDKVTGGDGKLKAKCSFCKNKVNSQGLNTCVHIIACHASGLLDEGEIDENVANLDTELLPHDAVEKRILSLTGLGGIIKRIQKYHDEKELGNKYNEGNVLNVRELRKIMNEKNSFYDYFIKNIDSMNKVDFEQKDSEFVAVFPSHEKLIHSIKNLMDLSQKKKDQTKASTRTKYMHVRNTTGTASKRKLSRADYRKRKAGSYSKRAKRSKRR